MAKILVIEDDAFIQDVMAYRLRNENYEVITAADGEQGIALAHAETPDLILMDIRLPTVDGWEAAARIKSSPHTQAIPIIAVTAQSLSMVDAKLRSVGCDAFAAKPINFCTLFTQIRFLIGARIMA